MPSFRSSAVVAACQVVKRYVFLCVVLPIILSATAFAQRGQECVPSQPGPGFTVDGGKIVMSKQAFETSADILSTIKSEFGNEATLAEWQRFKQILQTKAQVAKFIEVGILLQSANGPA